MVKITWLGHAAFHIEENGYVVLLDPWVNNPKASKSFQVTKADAILISHGHFDHIGDTVTLAKNNPSLKVFCIHEISIFLAKQGVPSGQIVGLNKGGTVDLGNGFSASFTTAVHSSSCGDHDTQIPGGEAGGWIIHTSDGHHIYHAGDTDVFGDMKLITDLYAPDIACLPIGGHYTMGPKNCGFAVTNFLTSVKTVIPMHFGTFPVLAGTPEQLKANIKRQGVEVKALQPGETATF